METIAAPATPKERIIYVDIVKALTIILVVIGHTNSPIQNFIYLFHMAVFFCVSGYFYNDSYSTNIVTLVKKRLKSLYIPFLIYEFIFLMLHNLFYYLNIYSAKVSYFGEIGKLYGPIDYLKNIFFILTFHNTEQLLKPFWFLIVLFVMNILFAMISYVAQTYTKKYSEWTRAFLIGICFIIGMILSHFKIVLSLNTNITLVAILIYYFGYLYKRYESRIRFNMSFILLAFAFLVVNSFFVKIEMSSNEYSNPLLFVINSLVGIYFMFGISRYLSLKKGKVLNSLLYIGLNTIPILALQLLCFKLINFLQVILYHKPLYMTAQFLLLDGSHGWWILYTIVGVIGPLVIMYPVRKVNKLGKKVFYNYKTKFVHLNHQVTSS